MKLEKLIERLELKNPPENKEIEIRRLIYDSRKVREGDLFVCIAGANFDAHDKAEEVARAGAAVIVAEREITVRPVRFCT